MTTWQLRFTYPKLPLSLNDRHHWATVAAAKAQLRNQVRYACRGQRIPRMERIHVQAHWTPATKRVRDADNCMLVVKVCIDGMRDYRARHAAATGRLISPAWTGIVADDDPSHVSWSPPIIRPVDKQLTERLWIDITDLSQEEA